MKERPILFSGEMVRAILEGRKTQTRRVITKAYDKFSREWAGSVLPARLDGYIAWWPGATMGNVAQLADFTKQQYSTGFPCPYGGPGDLLWVRETWAYNPDFPESAKQACYRADTGHDNDGLKWRPSIHMPRWASRITLRVKAVRVERLQDISQEDAKAEGWPEHLEMFPTINPGTKAFYWFKHLWDSINASRGYGWKVNPWLWVIEFERAQGKGM